MRRTQQKPFTFVEVPKLRPGLGALVPAVLVEKCHILAAGARLVRNPNPRTQTGFCFVAGYFT
jgi:hypothetical protein